MLILSLKREAIPEELEVCIPSIGQWEKAPLFNCL